MNKKKDFYKLNSVVKEYNPNGRKHIALLGGGMSSEAPVSKVSSEGCLKALLENGYRVTFIDFGADIAEVLRVVKPDVVFNCLHGTYGEDGAIPGLLNILRIPYTHSGVAASAVAFDKQRLREFFYAHNINCAEAKIVTKDMNYKTDPVPRPYVIKPLSEGSSIGVEVIFEEDDFSFADYDFPYGEKIFVEKYIKAREMQVAVLNGKALGILEIKLLKNRFYDYETKYQEGMAEHIIDPKLPEEIRKSLISQSEKIFIELGCRGVARVEFLYQEEEGKLYALEINTHPGMTPLSLVPEIAAHRGINFNKLMDEILETANYE